MGSPGKHKTHGKVKKSYKDWVEAVPHAIMHSKDQRSVVSIYKCLTHGHYHIGKQAAPKTLEEE